MPAAGRVDDVGDAAPERRPGPGYPSSYDEDAADPSGPHRAQPPEEPTISPSTSPAPGSTPPHGGPGWSPERRLRLARTLLALAAAVVAVVLVAGVVRGLSHGSQPAAAASSTTSARVTPTGDAASSAPGDDPSNYEGAAGSVGPTSTAIPTKGAGTFTILDAPGAPSTAQGRVVRYSLEVENGITVDKALFAKTVRDTLLDPRGWQTEDHVRFVNVPAKDVAAGAPVDVRVTLATPDTVDTLCAPLRTQGKVSCSNNGRAVLNLMRWETGAAAYGQDVARYRLYQINHEVGHTIGHGHRMCPKPGALAPVMLQQTLSLQGCVANTWPTATHG